MSYEEQPMGFGVDSPVKKKSKTITELSKEIRYKVIPGISGKALKSEVWYREEIQKARVSKYQRMLSSKHLQSYGKVADSSYYFKET